MEEYFWKPYYTTMQHFLCLHLTFLRIYHRAFGPTILSTCVVPVLEKIEEVVEYRMEISLWMLCLILLLEQQVILANSRGLSFHAPAITQYRQSCLDWKFNAWFQIKVKPPGIQNWMHCMDSPFIFIIPALMRPSMRGMIKMRVLRGFRFEWGALENTNAFRFGFRDACL